MSVPKAKNSTPSNIRCTRLIKSNKKKKERNEKERNIAAKPKTTTNLEQVEKHRLMTSAKTKEAKKRNNGDLRASEEPGQTSERFFYPPSAHFPRRKSRSHRLPPVFLPAYFRGA